MTPTGPIELIHELPRSRRAARSGLGPRLTPTQGSPLMAFGDALDEWLQLRQYDDLDTEDERAEFSLEFANVLRHAPARVTKP